MPSPASTGPITSFGERLLAACKLRGLSPRELGRLAGYQGRNPDSRIYQLVRTARPSLAVVERLAKALELDRSELDPTLAPTERKVAMPKSNKVL